MARIDAHQHFWRLDRGDYGWLTPELAPIYRDFLPADLAPLLAKASIDGTILVQAAPTVAETHFMLDIARETPWVLGVVGWVDFDAQEAPDQIAELASDPCLVGLRPMIQDIPDDTWMLSDHLGLAFEAIIAADLTFDALTLPRHLPHLKTLLRRHPGLRTVIDHGSKPFIAAGQMQPWAEDMAELAAMPGLCCKLSGLITEAGTDWAVDRLRPYVSHLLACFGPDRLIWGSDWPVCTLAGQYEAWVAATDALLADVSEAGRAAILGGNAERLYGVRANT